MGWIRVKNLGDLVVGDVITWNKNRRKEEAFIITGIGSEQHETWFFYRSRKTAIDYDLEKPRLLGAHQVLTTSLYRWVNDGDPLGFHIMKD